MKQEQKELLLKDLCARLPYGVKTKFGNYSDNHWIKGINIDCDIDDYTLILGGSYDIGADLEEIKPYLRPMSSMTEEEKKEFIDAVTWEANGKFYIDECEDITFYQEKYDWLNAHHFDYRGLIEKGLAISTEEFNPYKD